MNCKFRVVYNSAISETQDILAGVPQGSTLSSILFLSYTAGIPIPNDVTVSMFADNTAIMATHRDYHSAVNNLQKAVDSIVAWFHKWKISINEKKSKKVEFTLRPHPSTPILINGRVTPNVPHS